MLCWKKEILVGGAQLLPYGLLPVLHQEPPAAGVQAPSEDTGRQLSAHLNRHCTKYNKKHQLNEPLKIYYSMMQSNTIYPMFQSGNIFCAVHVKLPQSVQVFICTLLFLCLPQCAVFQCSLDWQIGFKQTWFLLIYVFALWVFLYLCYHIVVWLCIQAHVNFQFFALQSGTVLDEFVVLCHPVFVSFVFLYLCVCVF